VSVDSSQSPLVSVLTPAYNSAKFIRQTLESALSQTFTNFEMIVIDDGSTDDTRLIADSYAARDPRFRVISQPNGGIAAARNSGMRVARGQYFALLDSDDVWLPCYLADQLAILAAHPEIAVLSANAINFGGVFDGTPLLATWPRRIRHVSLLELVAVEDSLCILSIFRREVSDAIGGFDATLRRSEDYDLWLRAAAAGYRIAVNPQPLGLYRRRPDSVSADEVLMLEAMKAPLLKIRRLCPDRPDVVLEVDRQLARVARRSLRAAARSALIDGDMAELRRHLAALATETGAVRYRLAGWLAGTAPSVIAGAYACKQKWLLRRRPARGYWSMFAPRVARSRSSDQGIERALRALRRVRLERDAP
jgi:cellulose synthase/poly-beta-1,6-N-acetylglucosamine synthase-like glycosyltransferase